MATSFYSSTEETTNTNRACRLLLGPCTDELRDVLRHHVPPPTFPQVIVQRCINLPRLTVPQRNLILPRNNSYTGNYNDMDISLLCILLRNICSIPPHSKGWGNDPDPTDRSLAANIERIRIARNQCVHSSSPVLSNADFNTIWSTVRSAVMDLDSFLNNGNQYEREVDFLRHETMDPVRDRHYTEELRRQAEEDTATREMIHGLKRKLEESDTDRIEYQNKMQKTIDEIANTAVPPNVKAIHKDDVLKWKEDDKVFHESHNFPAMLEKVRNQTHVTFVGVPGSGKTATIRHIALKLQQKEGYDIVPIKNIKKIEDYCDPENPQVFVIDDVVGVFGLQETKLNLLSDYQDRIKKPIMSKSKTLMTCREAVYRKTIESSSFFTEEKNIVLLHSEVNALNNSDKMEIMKKYKIDVNLLSPLRLTSASKMIPYLCKLYSTEKKFQRYGPAFFENPVPCILKELDEMQKQNKIHYVSLVLCMMNGNKISKKMLKEKEKERVIKNFNEMKDKVLEKFDISSNPLQFVNALSEMKGTYTEFCSTEYSFLHDSMFEIVAYHFGCQFPKLILKFLSSSYIANYVKLHRYRSQRIDKEIRQESGISGESKRGEENVEVSGESKQEEEKIAARCESCDGMKSIEIFIRLGEEHFLKLAERLYKDIENMELYDVFMNNVLKEPKMCQAFIEVLTTKSYTELKSLFLSVQKNVSKIVSNRERVSMESKKRNCESMEWQRQRVLVNKRELRETTYRVRVISWVIYYGHNQILKYILEQTEQHKETESELFMSCFNPDLSNGVEERINTHEQYRLLVLSCYSGDLETVRIILQKINRNKGNKALTYCSYDHMLIDTPLTAACEGGHMSVVKELLEAGADVNLQGQFDTPLTAACEVGHICVVKELIRAGADVNLQGELHTPLMTACESGHKRIVKELIEAGASVKSLNKYNTPLTAACANEDMSLVKELIELGADVNSKGEYHTPLTAACSRGHLSLVKELLEAGADLNLQDNFNTPLTAACKDGHLNVVKELLKAGADVDLQSDFKTPLKIACEGGDLNVVKELLEAGANINAQDSVGRTPLYAAVLNDIEGLIPAVQILKKYGADPSICNKDGLSPIFIALFNYRGDVVTQLLKTENESQLNKLKLHLFDCLVNIRNSDVMTDSKDDIVTQRQIWRIKESGDLCRMIKDYKCEVLKHLVVLGLDVNHWIQLYDIVDFERNIGYESKVRPLLFTLMDNFFCCDRIEKVRILLEAGVDVNVRVRYMYRDSGLDREDVSVLERTRRLVNMFKKNNYGWEKLKASEYKTVLGEIKKHVRRYSL